EIDLLHAHTPRSAMIAARAARRLGIPFVFHVHSPTSRDSTRWLTNWCNHAIEWWSIRQADAIVTVSDTLREHTIASGIAADRVSVVANGVPRQAPVARSILAAPTVTLGSIALFRPRKGTEVLLEALLRLRQRGHDVRLRAIGGFETEEYGESLRAKAAELGVTEHVDWTGFTRDVDAALESIDMFVLPSLFGEGMPMVVLEAMAAGLPVVATKVEGVPQVITDGVHGRLAEPASVDSLCEVLESLIVDRAAARDLGGQGRERQRQCFSDRSMAEGVAEVYRRVLEL
ncbi:MAG: glycosyltransferase family 4 protein, partial [Planctomycetales bacterium]|nr:glycosyltransferase family 4 protein [Planctomycetales bacterium]